MAELKDNLRELRKQHHLKQWELAEIAGVSKNMMSMCEKGRRSMSRKHLKNICSYFDVGMGWLLGEDDSAQTVLTPTERSLVDAYRKLSGEMKSAVNRLLDIG